jgi:hypothetical protein
MTTLTNKLADLMHQAAASPGLSVHTKLAHGLHVWVRSNGNQYHLAICRKKTKPSLREWNTCCAHWPYKLAMIPTPVASQDEHNINFYLSSILPAK